METVTKGEGATKTATKGEDAMETATKDEDATKTVTKGEDATETVTTTGEDATETATQGGDAMGAVTTGEDATKAVKAAEENDATPTKETVRTCIIRGANALVSSVAQPKKSRANSCSSAMRSPCYSSLQEMAIQGVIYGVSCGGFAILATCIVFYCYIYIYTIHPHYFVLLDGAPLVVDLAPVCTHIVSIRAHAWLYVQPASYVFRAIW